MNTSLLQEVERFVTALMEEKLPKELFYHDITHTREVANRALEIGKGEKLTNEELEIVAIAGWFHDVGYTEQYVGHEEESQIIAENFLRSKNYPEEKITIIKNCILATKYMHEASNIIESILIDADRLSMGLEDFEQRGELLRKEWEVYLDKHYTDKEWCDIQVKYLQETEFLTRYAFQQYQEQKDRNLKLFKERSIQLERETSKIGEQSKTYLIQLSNILLRAAGSILLGIVIGISLSLTVWGNFGYSWGIGSISGFLIGLALHLGNQPFERFVIRKFSFPWALFVGTFTLIALFKLAQYSGMLIYDLLVAEMGLAEIFKSKIFKDIISTRGIMIMLWSAFLISVILNIIKLTSRIIGPQLMKNYLLGMYHKPVEEERIFMFIDINSSTSLAEKMGTEKYHELLNSFFYDIGQPISKSKGEIYQYVGDEVVITWKMKDGLENANCIGCYFRIVKQMEKLRPKYIKKFGFCPEFKVGMHGGKVITGEVGRTKTEIVFHGDVINTTERILNQCINLGKKMLISENLLRRLDLLPSIHAEYVTTRLFKGKENEVSLYTLIKE